MSTPADPTPVSGTVVPTRTGPGSEHLGASEAGRVLGISPRRVRAYVAAGRLTVVTDKPLKVSRESVQVLAAERAAAGLDKPTPAPSIDPAQLEAINAALATLLVEVAALRTDLATTRNELATERQQRHELEAAAPPKRWWKKATPG